MALVVAILLAFFVMPRPWGWALVAGAVVWEVVTFRWQWRWSRSRKKVVGPAALLGRTVEVAADGWVRVDGERWRARGAGPGERARVVAIDGLTLVVERED